MINYKHKSQLLEKSCTKINQKIVKENPSDTIEKFSIYLEVTMADKDFLIKYDEDMEENILCRYVGKNKIVKIPEGVMAIRKYAFASDFESNETIEKIILPSTVLRIEEEAFAYCTNLKKIVFNDEVEDISFSCIKGCDLIEELTIPPRVESVIVFPRPKNLKKIYVNDNIKHISEDAFDIYVEELNKYERHTNEVLLTNPVYKIIDGFMVNTKFMTTLYRTDKSKKKVRVPDGIKVIGSSTFDEMEYRFFEDDFKCAKRIESIILPKSVERINYFAFLSCEKLRSVKYEGKIADLDIDEDAFEDCKHYLEHNYLIECSDQQIYTKKKRITHLMLERFKIIHRAIRSGQYPNTEKLRQICRDELGVDNTLSIATISRDLEYLRNSMDAPIEYDRYRNGYYYTEEFELLL